MNLLPQCVHFVKDSEFRGFVVPALDRGTVVSWLQSESYSFSSGIGTLHHKALPPDSSSPTPCVHVPSAGGAEPADDDGEPERAEVGKVLLQEVPPGFAIVIWRRFGGTFLGVSSGVLIEAYRVVAHEAVRRHTLLSNQNWKTFFTRMHLPIVKPYSSVETQPWQIQTIGGDWQFEMPESLAPLVVELPVPCVYYDSTFLPEVHADVIFKSLLEGVKWELPPAGSSEDRATAVYSEVEYNNRDGKGYVTSSINSWEVAPLELLDLKRRAEEWHAARTGFPVKFDVCLLNLYSSGSEHLAWHSDREEIDPMQRGPRTSPIASISLGAERSFGFLPKWSAEIESQVRAAADGLASSDAVTRNESFAKMCNAGFRPIRLAHGSLCIMENVCQLLYKHALLPEHSCGPRINVTFRAKGTVEPATRPPPPPSSEVRAEKDSRDRLFVGLAPDVDHRVGQGWKHVLYHPFETPFIDEAADVAAARYQTWLSAQPVFKRWLLTQLSGRQVCVSDGRDVSHAQMLTALANAHRSAGGSASRSRI